ncbi:MAG: hypothetical protein ACLPX9_08850 [Rhodomicrobium sp.]
MFWTGSKSPLEAEEEDWLAECAWLLEEFGPGRLKQTPLVLPSGEFFPPTKSKGHARAEHLFDCVKRLAGTENWPYKLVPQESCINPVLSGLAVVKNAPSDPAGTLLWRQTGRSGSQCGGQPFNDLPDPVQADQTGILRWVCFRAIRRLGMAHVSGRPIPDG